MISIISLLTAIGFAAIYPLCFWIHRRNPLKNDYHKFHIGLPNFVGGVAVVSLFFFEPTRSLTPLLVLAVFWKVFLLSISSYFWKKGWVPHLAITVPCLMGMALGSWLLYVLVYAPLSAQPNYLLPNFIFASIAYLLGLFVFCLSIYTMNLGHWYLNVHGLPLEHLKTAVGYYAVFLGIRLLWDIGWMLLGKTSLDGEIIPLWQFALSLEGVFLWVALFFGTFFPFASLYYVKGTLDVKSTQSATGILYVILSGVIIGDISYKYYLIRFGIPL